MRMLIAALVTAACCLSPSADAAVELETVLTTLGAPVAITHAGDDRLFISEIGGVVRIVRGDQLLAEPFLDIALRVNQGNGRGLWSIAFHPLYPATPYVFAHYVERGTEDSIIARFEVSPDDPNLALPSSEVILLRMPKPIRLHYGGQLAFGPDGYLYISTGDGTDGDVGPDPLCLSQKLDSLEGKLLRIDVDADGALFGIPPGNPFAGSAEPSIWAYGLRNPWRFSFDREQGELWISDVGENRREEINRQSVSSVGGENYGWKIMEGTECFSNLTGCGLAPACNDSGLTLPAIDYGHGQGRCSVIGGYVYRGSLVPELYGRYVYGDFCTGEVWHVDAVAPSFAGSTRLAQTAPLLGSFGESADGELYAVGGGTLYRFVDPAVTGAGVVEFDRTDIAVNESAGTVTVPIRRLGRGEGAVSVELRTVAGSASGASDFVPVTGVRSWQDGELGAREVTVQILGDTDFESDESFEIVLENPGGGARLGPRSRVTGTILDDDRACTPSSTVLCLNDGRFRVAIDWNTADASGQGQGVDLSQDSGYFWFFGADNPEIFVKILNACADPFNHYWVFIAGLTDVGTAIEVVDTVSGEVRNYGTDLGQGFEAIRDTSAFATCP